MIGPAGHARGIWSLALALLLGFPAATLAAQEQPTVTPVSGLVEIRVPPAQGFQPVAESARYPGDAVLRTGGDGFALIRYPDSTEIVVRPGSEVELGGEGRSGVQVFIGKALLRVRRLLTPGQERTHRTPTTVAAVRGTEFGLSVEGDGRTRVFVFEGLVAVSNAALPDAPVEVPAGSMTEVAPHRPPTEPRAFQSGEFERGGAGEVERGEDRAVEAGQAPTTARYLAFPDLVLDALENPAYLSAAPSRGGSALLLGSWARGSATVTRDGATTFSEEDRRSRGLAQALAWVSPGGGWKVGASLQGDLGEDRGVLEVRDPGYSQAELLRDDSEWTVGEGRLMAALRRNRMGFGVGVGHRQGSLDSESSPAGSLGEPSRTEGESNLTSLSAGIRMEGQRTLGLSYHRAWFDETRESSSTVVDAEGTRDALEALLRSWRERAGWGAWLRLERTSTVEDRRDQNVFTYREELEVWTLRGGLGLGFMPTPSFLMSLDLAGGAAAEAANQRNSTGQLLEDEDDLRLSGSIHLGMQAVIHGPWRAEASVLHQVERIDRTYDPGPAGASSRTTDVRSLFGTLGAVGLLYVADPWTVRYAITSPGESGRAWVHSLMVSVGPG